MDKGEEGCPSSTRGVLLVVNVQFPALQRMTGSGTGICVVYRLTVRIPALETQLL